MVNNKNVGRSVGQWRVWLLGTKAHSVRISATFLEFAHAITVTHTFGHNMRIITVRNQVISSRDCIINPRTMQTLAK